MVSIIIPLYNAERYIKETLVSCLRQTLKELEIVVVDDCSKDMSVNVVEDLMKTDQRLYLIKNRENQGCIKTINIGIRESRGEYILVLGQDDRLEPDHIERMYKIMRSGDYSLLYCTSRLMDQDGKWIGESNTIDIAENPNIISRKNIINSCGAMIHAGKLKQAGLYPEELGFRNYGEWYLWIQLMALGKVKFVSEIKSNYRIHSGNLSRTLYNKENMLNTKRYNLLCMNLACMLLNLEGAEKIKWYVYRVIYVLKSDIRRILKR